MVAGNGPVGQTDRSPVIAEHGRAGLAHAERRRPVKKSSYGERDYAFGQRMLTLRTSICGHCGETGPTSGSIPQGSRD